MLADFYTVSHDAFISKVKETNIKWIHNWLDDHAHRVVINDSVSKWEVVSSGVAQGSAPDLLLFNILFKDLENEIE